jgi:hypothetical protein
MRSILYRQVSQLIIRSLPVWFTVSKAVSTTDSLAKQRPTFSAQATLSTHFKAAGSWTI